MSETPDGTQREALIRGGSCLRICEEIKLKQKWRDWPEVNLWDSSFIGTGRK